MDLSRSPSVMLAEPISSPVSSMNVPSEETSSLSRRLKVLDLFAGLEGWSSAFREQGHDVCSVDFDPRFDVTITADILKLRREDLPWTDPDIILASPPCEGFTVMNIGKNWTRPTDDPPNAPKTPLAAQALALVQRTRQIIDALQPRYFIIENPRAKLRRMPIMDDLERRTVWYCHLLETAAKPTDLFGVFPPSLVLPDECHNQRASHPVDCCCRDHTSAPRGSRTPGSIQGVTGPDADATRAEIPHELSRLVCDAVAHDIVKGS